MIREIIEGLEIFSSKSDEKYNKAKYQDIVFGEGNFENVFFWGGNFQEANLEIYLINT